MGPTLSREEESDVVALYESLIEAWNRRDARAFSGAFAADCLCVGFDGTQYDSASEIGSALAEIFGDHRVATYVTRVRSVRRIGADAALLHAVAGMVPPGGTSVMAERDAVQVLVAIRDGGRWRAACFQNTPARFDGRPRAVEDLTRELQSELENSQRQ